ncbi:MAG TPA: rhamnulokinase family protein [Candidatus Sulfotelmatobacter sp.]|nr:rhamnulokinase family protein [Candidatus Sulfotelmatobacter sp.]
MKRPRQIYLAVDLGASSGRIVAGLWDGKVMALDELHRFPNGPVYLAGSMRWDVLRIWSEIQTGLAIAGKKYGKKIVSVGADTWGSDYVLLSRSGEILGQPFHYRDNRTGGMMEKAFRKMPRDAIFARAGTQFQPFNTLFQLLALREQSPELLAQADCLLLMPDFIHWCLCGSRVAEFTNATTTQCLHPLKRKWAGDLLKKMQLPASIFPKVVPPGTKLGTLRDSVAGRPGLGKINVVAPATHDTASAVVGMPTAHTGKTNWAYISSGTWSLMGVELRQACLAPRVLELNMTNEGGFGGTYRLLKNIMGLWLVQECKRSFDSRGGRNDYDELERAAAAARPLRSLLDVNRQQFYNPPDMPRAIQDACRRTGQPVPQTKGELIRCAYESLALQYRRTLGCLEELTSNRIDVIHIAGGGSQNRLLNQFTADACRRPVLAGPVEATVMGNLLVQACAAGEVGSLSEMREVIRRSSSITNFEPANSDLWDGAADRFERLCSASTL